MGDFLVGDILFEGHEVHKRGFVVEQPRKILALQLFPVRNLRMPVVVLYRVLLQDREFVKGFLKRWNFVDHLIQERLAVTQRIADGLKARGAGSVGVEEHVDAP